MHMYVYSIVNNLIKSTKFKEKPSKLIRFVFYKHFIIWH